MELSGLVRVIDLKDGPNQYETSFTAEQLEIMSYHGTELTLFGPVATRLNLLRRGKEIYVTGTVRFRAQLKCAQCCCAFTRDFLETVSVEFCEASSMDDACDHVCELDESDLSRAFYRNGTLDMLALIRDTIILAIPIAPHCTPDCTGIDYECELPNECYRVKTQSPLPEDT